VELYYNPEQMSESEIKDTFVARQWMLDELLSTVKKQPKGAGVQHVLIIGPRGMGKTTMLLMLRFGILESEFSQKWMPVRFPEESYSVTDLADFWISVIAHLSCEINDPQLLSAVNELKRDSRDSTELADSAVATLKNWCRKSGKRIALLVDNLDLILQQVRDENENARLREVLMNDGTFMLAGTATSFFKEARAYEQPLYNFFKTYDLTSLTSDQVDDLLRRRAAVDKNPGFEEQMKRNAARIRVLRYFTGGSPRLVLMLYRIVASAEPVDVKRGLEKLLDEVTPYYKSKIEILPPQQRKILDNLARVSGKTHEGLTPTQLAQETRLPVNQVSSQLKRLSELGYVAAANVRSKNSYYSLAEPLYAIWHQMRFGRGNRQRLDWLVEFLKGWYSEDEGLAQCLRLAESFKGLLAGGDAGRIGEALDIRQCFVDALPQEQWAAATGELIRDCLAVGDLSRVKEILTAATGERLTREKAATVANVAESMLDVQSFMKSKDHLGVLSALDGLTAFLDQAAGLRWVRAKALRAVGRKREALQDYDAYLAGEQNDEAELQRADLLLDLHEYDSALEAANRVVATSPNALSAHVIRAVCLEVGRQFDEARRSWLQAIENGAPEGLRLRLAPTMDHPLAQSLFRFLILVTLGDQEKVDEEWGEVADALREPNAAAAFGTSLRMVLAPRNLELLQRLIKSTTAEEILLPLARAIDYLISCDRAIIEKLSAEIRPIVEEIVVEYEKKYPPTTGRPAEKPIGLRDIARSTGAHRA
jgi:tetratricopeptide (TPR) repeat protein